MNKWIYFALALSILQSDIVDHLKIVQNKSAAYSMPGIDFIYLINLDERPEKLKRSLDQLGMFNIHPCRFPAINGWKLTLDEIEDVGLRFTPWMEGGITGISYSSFAPNQETIGEFGKSYFSPEMSRGAIGSALSHLSILQDAYQSGYETIWVMEDDIELIQDPRTLSNLVRKLDETVGVGSWDILFTDRDQRDENNNYITIHWAGTRPDYIAFSKEKDFAVKKEINSNFIQVGARLGKHSMIIRRSGVQKLLTFFSLHQLFFPYDRELILPRGINLYTVQNDIVSNFPKDSSDKNQPNYEKL